MRKLIMWNVITLDGYFEGKKPWDLDFHQTVWGDELEKLSVEQLATADALIFGENTYLGMADYWVDAKDQPEAEPMNQIRKYVCSATLKTADWNNTQIIRNAVKEISQLKTEGDGNLFVFGSGMLSASLMKAGLFDEYRLCIAPVFLGQGRRLFESGLPHEKLKFIKSTSLKTGGVILIYEAKK